MNEIISYEHKSRCYKSLLWLSPEIVSPLRSKIVCLRNSSVQLAVITVPNIRPNYELDVC